MMNPRIWILLLALEGVASFAAPVTAGEIQELREEVRVLGGLIKDQRQAIKTQQETIDALERRVEELQAVQALRTGMTDAEPPRTVGRPTAAAGEVPPPKVTEEVAVPVGEVPTEASEQEVAALSSVLAGVAEELHRSTRVDLYSTLEYEQFEQEKSTFDARNIEILLATEPHPRVRLGAEIEFEGTAKTSEGPRQGEVEVEQGWMELRLASLLSLRGGVILVPFGAYNLNHFDSFRELVDRPIMARHIVPTTWAEAGMGVAGQTRLPHDVLLRYQTYLVNGLTDRFSDSSIRSARGAFRSDNNDSKALVGRTEFTILRGQRLGLSGYYGDYNGAGDSMAGVDVDWNFSLEPFELLGEYAHFSLEEGFEDSGLTTPDELEGFYAQVNYRFWPEALRKTWLGRTFPKSRLTAALRWGFGEIADDGDPRPGTNREQRLSLGLNYRPLPTFVLKAQYEFNGSRNEALERGDKDGFLASISAAF